jgi:glutaredoxin
MKKFIIFLLLFSLAFSRTCVVYITGIGCPHCAKVDPIIFERFEELNLTVIEYEIYKEKENSEIVINYWRNYNIPAFYWGVPFLFFDEKNYIAGDEPIIQNLENYSKRFEGNECLLLNEKKKFEEIDFNSLPGKPKIFYNNRILVKGSSYLSNEIIKEALNEDISIFIEKYKNIIKENSEKCVEYSFGKKCFSKSFLINDWQLFFNIEEIKESGKVKISEKNDYLLIIIVILVVIFSILIYSRKRIKKK